MDCKKCGARCIAPSITTAMPGMPEDKPVGMGCIHLDEANLCRLYAQPRRPSDISLSSGVGANHDLPLLGSYPTLKSLLDVLRRTEPQRARTLYRALQRIELIRRESVIMMMPYDMIVR